MPALFYWTGQHLWDDFLHSNSCWMINKEKTMHKYTKTWKKLNPALIYFIVNKAAYLFVWLWPPCVSILSCTVLWSVAIIYLQIGTIRYFFFVRNICFLQIYEIWVVFYRIGWYCIYKILTVEILGASGLQCFTGGPGGSSPVISMTLKTLHGALFFPGCLLYRLRGGKPCGILRSLASAFALLGFDKVEALLVWCRQNQESWQRFTKYQAHFGGLLCRWQHMTNLLYTFLFLEMVSQRNTHFFIVSFSQINFLGALYTKLCASEIPFINCNRFLARFLGQFVINIRNQRCWFIHLWC